MNIDVTSPTFWQTAGIAFAICAGASLIAVITLLITAWQHVIELDIPPDADFFETLQMIPISVPIALDLLDLAFDVFSAPISWVILELMGLRALQMITVIEGIIPGTQLIPTMTIAWFVARGMKRKNRGDTPFRSALRDAQGQSQGQYGSLGPGGSRQDSLSLRNKYRSQDLLPSGGANDPLGAPPPRRTRIPSGGIGSTDVIEGEFTTDDGADDFGGDYSEEEQP